MKRDIYNQLIDIALDTKDFEWIKQLQEERLSGGRQHKEVTSQYLSFKLSDIYHHSSSTELKFTFDENSIETVVPLGYLLKKDLDITINLEDNVQLRFQGTLEGLSFDWNSLKVKTKDAKSLNGILGYIDKNIEISFKEK